MYTLTLMEKQITEMARWLVSVILKTVVICVLIVLPNLLFSQKGNIKGRITTADGKPASHMSVVVKNTQEGSTSNENGDFFINGIKSGKYILLMSAVGIASQELDVVVQDGKTAIADFEIKNITWKELENIVITQNKNSYIANQPSTSLRVSDNLLIVPQNITITTQQINQDMGNLNVSEMYRTVAGALTYFTDGIESSVLLRGTSSYYNTMRNGVGAGYFYNQQADVGIIDRIEFVKGPAGFIMGNTDPSGLVNVVTKQPVRKRLAAGNIGFGSWNMMRATLDFGGELKKDGPITYRLNVGVQRQQASYQFGYLRKYYMALALKYDIAENTNITVEYNYNRGHALDGGQFLPTVNGKFFVVPSSISIADPTMTGLYSYDHYLLTRFSHKLSDNWSFNAHTGYIKGQWLNHTMSFQWDAVVTNDTIYRNIYFDDYRNQLFSASGFLSGNFNTGNMLNHQLLAGVDYGWTEIKDTYESQTGSILGLNYLNPSYFLPPDSVSFRVTMPYDFMVTNSFSAFFLQDNVKIGNKFLITVGGRFTHCSIFNSNNASFTQTEKKFTPRLAFTYLINKNSSVYFLLDQSFLPQVGKTYGEKQFLPLTGTNKEIGYKALWMAGKLSTSVGAYYTIRNNVLTVDPEHPDFEKTTGRQISKGIEIDIKGNITPNLSCIANYAYVDVRNAKSADSSSLAGLYAFNSPVHHVANLFVKYMFSKGWINGFSLGVGARYVDKRNSSVTANEFVPAITLFESAVAYTTGIFTINFNAYNLTNRKYVSYVYKYQPTDWQYQPGQPFNFRIGMGIRF